MISKDNLADIKKYLQSKNLSSSVFDEVYDHFVMQISSEMSSGNLCFVEAFIAVKTKWRRQLEMVKVDFFSFKKVARIERDILQRRFRKMMYISLCITAIAGILSIISESVYYGSIILMLSVYFGFSLFMFLSGKIKFSEFIQNSFHPLLMRSVFMMVLLMLVCCVLEFSWWKIIDEKIFQLILIYGMMINVQMLYFKTKKINVLFS